MRNHTRTAPAERICARKSQRWQPGDERERPRTGRRAAIHSLLPIRLESEQQPCSTSNNLTQDDRGGLDGENLRAKIATMAAGRRARTIPGGQEQARRDGGASN